MTRPTLALACLALALVACSRDDATPAAVPAPTAAAPVVEPAPVAAAPAEFDMRAYAGMFVAGDDRLELAADGSYRLLQAGATPDGTWTVEQGHTRVRLDPNSKAEPDRVLMMDGRDRLTALDEAGQPAANAQAWTREAAPEIAR